ncbi:MAG: hypothetical protein KA401_01105 [Anaerolineae bacterium]|nr:hypothetical protein [Chloroflexota bacterium]MBP6297916.1 hypothetical protein [Anaerolineae bacterium]
MTQTSIVITAMLVFLVFLVQRSEKKARRKVFLLSAIMFFVMRQFAFNQGNEGMAWQALLIALAVNFIFWFIVGRYNPTGSSDDITVIGMDD